MLSKTLQCTARPLSLRNKTSPGPTSAPRLRRPEIKERLRLRMLGIRPCHWLLPKGSCWDHIWMGQWVEMKGYVVSETFLSRCLESHHKKKKIQVVGPTAHHTPPL